jgi:type II secretory pathway pseudopilin PulG
MPMRNFTRSLARHEGFTLVEVLAASLILVVGVLATVGIVNAAAGANATTRQRDAANNLARELIEGARSIPYEKVSTPGVITELQKIPGLEDTAGGAYTIRRNGITYTVGVDVCITDDAKDGGGPRPATATFCPSSTAAGTADKNPEDYKRVSTTVTWRRNSADMRVVQTGIVNNPGSASGPAVRLITPVGHPAPYEITDPAATSVAFEATTSSKPATMNWLVDGTVRQPPPVEVGATGLLWTFTWDIGDVNSGGVLDGDYIVSAEAFNQYGLSGPGRQETVRLNRRVPFAPPQVTGGRTGFGTVEIEWTANSERDIIGYQVYREGTATPICALAAQKLDTICTDHAPPPTDPLKYTVYAYDQWPGTGTPRQGDASDPLFVVADNSRPFPPTNFDGTRDAATGTVTLTWDRPSPQDPDTGDSIEFYRIYRDGILLVNRYARWFDSGVSPVWEDTQTGGTTHTYWVTAVDQYYAESLFAGPVIK